MTSLSEFLDDEFSFLSKIPQETVSTIFDEIFSIFSFTGVVDNLNFFDGNQSVMKLYKLGHLTCDSVLFSNNNERIILSKDKLLQYKRLCILLWYGVENALKNMNKLETLKDGLFSARCYLLLASINGNVEYDIYQDNIIRECLNLFTKVLNIIISSRSEVKNRTNKSKKNKNLTINYLNNDITLSNEEVIELEKNLKISLDGLFILSEKVSLAKSEDNIQLFCKVIRNLFKVDLSQLTNVKICQNINEFREITKFSDIGFALLHSLCHSRHRALENIYPVIIMPRIMYASIDNDQFLPNNCHINIEMVNICEIFINFLKERIRINEPEQDIIYRILISSCLKCPERAEYRTKIIKSVFDVVNCLPLDYRKRFVEDILLIGENTQAVLRAFAIEFIPLIYKKFDFIGIDNSTNCSGNLEIKEEIISQSTSLMSQEPSIENRNYELEFIKLVVCGIEDKFSCVRQRALSIIPLFFKNNTLINQCNNACIDLFKELHKIELKKYNNKRKNYQSSDIPKKRNRLQLNNNDNEEEDSLKTTVDTSSDQNNIDKEKNGNELIDASDNLQEDFNNSSTTTEMNINSMGIDMNNTQINVQIISDRDGIFERKRVFKVSDYPLLNRLLVRCDDCFVACRKSVIEALECLFPFLTNEGHIDAVISQFCRLARSKSVLIRKQIAGTVYNLLFHLNEDHISYEKLIIASMECIFLQVNDREMSVQLNAAKIVKNMIFLPLINEEITNKIAWRILSICEKTLTYQKTLKQIVPFLVKEKLIGNDLIHSMDRVINNLEDITCWQSIWMLYSILSIFFNVNPGNASEEFLKINSYNCTWCQELDDYTEEGKALFAKKNKEIFEKAQQNMELLMFEKFDGDENNFNSSTFDFSPSIIEKDRDDIKLAKILSVIGEIIDYEQSLINKDLFEMLQLIMSSKTCVKALRIFQEQTLNGTLTSSIRQNTQMSNFSSKKERKSLSIIKKFKTHHVKYTSITSIVRAHCIILIGKICLVNDMFAKDVIPVFMKELIICRDYIIRNNIIIVTHDLCKHHTSLVGSYLNIFGACLSDESVAVRIHTIHCLTKLLKEGYLLLKSDILYRFICTLLDKVERVKDYAEFCLIETLLPVTPDMFFANFIDCIYYFNEVEHPSWIACDQAKGKTNSGIFYKGRSLKGTNFQNDRLKLYCFMLKNMTVIQKVAITQKICTEIFKNISHKLVNLDDINVQNMLMDSFKLLSSEESKVRFNMQKDGEEGDDNVESELRREVIVKTAEKFSKQTLKEIFIKELIHYLLELRDTLYEAKNSLCSLEFLKFLLHLSNEFNYEFNKIIDENKYLASNIRYDILRVKNKLDQEYNI